MLRNVLAFLPLMAGVLAGLQVHDDSFAPNYVLEVTRGEIQINCETRRSVTINGTYPGPTIHLTEGQTSWIRVYNRMPDKNTTIHWHGLSQRAAPFSDGTPLVSQWPIPPNHFFDYEIKPEIGDAGTYFYHSHVGFQHMTAQGSLIVHDARQAPYQYNDDITLLVGDYYTAEDETIEAGLLADPFKWSGEPQAITVQGKSGKSGFDNATDCTCAPHVIDVEPGKRYRVRVIGATALSMVKLGIEDHEKLEVIEADGSYTQPVEIDHVQVSSGQRFSYLLSTKPAEDVCTEEQGGQESQKKSQFWIRYESRDRPKEITGYALLRYRCPQMEHLSSPLPASEPLTLPNATSNYLEYALQPLSELEGHRFPRLSEVTRTVTIQINQVLTTGKYVNGTLNGTLVWVQNGHEWREKTQEAINQVPYLIRVYESGQVPNYTLALENDGYDPVARAFPAKVGEVLDIVWENNNGPTGGWDFHPMHIHGWHPWDLGCGNGTYDAVENEKHFENFTPARRDTMNLYRYAVKGEPHTTAGWRAWRIRITEQNIGAWMMHCHILQHMVMGMATVWVFGDAADIETKFPTIPYTQGYVEYGGSAYGSDTQQPVVNHYF
ncbi:hypothetical protein FZEAL_6716 [Fusarium zealandicum]|uniref:L-ascorbate oxidase n=1 Tax=Fusarium zealandicum TaxID=1053134 RepID=A0A8H4UHI4_9HYPO|nr:hypothetical protein FZEAL_6716 [Fusarium zealandicum]